MPSNLRKHCYDHEGNEFFSIKDMTESWGISSKRFFQRLQRGWSLERALTTPISRKNVQQVERRKEKS